MPNKPTKITDALIPTIQYIVKEFCEGRITLRDAVNYLVGKMGINPTTARIHLEFFKTMSGGYLYKSTRGPNIPSVRYFFEEIIGDNKEGLKSALKSLWDCIEYTEPRRNYTLKGFRAIHVEFSAKLK